MKIIYIISLSHSGSTLLDLMLHAHPEVFSVGEIKSLSRIELKAGGVKKCTCGAYPFLACPFWSKVDEWLLENSGCHLVDIVGDPKNKATPSNSDITLIFNAISAISGKKFIVDSSKCVWRLKNLLANSSLEVFPIFLIRDPFGQINSSLKSDFRKGRISPTFFPKLLKLFILIIKYNYMNFIMRLILRRAPHEVIYYENLVRNPEQVLSKLMQKIGLEFDSNQLNWAGVERHHAGGNRMRRKMSNELRLDESWKSELRFWQKALIYIGTFFNRYHSASK